MDLRVRGRGGVRGHDPFDCDFPPHQRTQRLALKLAILLPPLALMVLLGLMAIEGDYTFVTRLQAFVQQIQTPGEHREVPEFTPGH